MIKNRKPIIAVVLVVGAVISLIYGLSSPAKRKTRTQAAPGSAGVISEGVGIGTEARIVSVSRHAKETEYPRWGRNPFVPELSETTGSKFALGGIMWHKENPRVMINGELLGKGDKIRGYTVIAIKKHSVILSDGMTASRILFCV
jgi:hypothetical protein